MRARVRRSQLIFSCYSFVDCPGRTGVALNVAILCLLGYLLLVIGLVSAPQWKRERTPDERRKY